MNLKKLIKIFFDLGKIRITVFVAFSTSIGYVLYSGKIDLNIIPPLLGVFFLAVGSAALNHLQEYKFDKIMARTQNRPLPSNLVTKKFVLIFVIFFVVLGSLILYLVNISSLILGLITLFWYNLVYTPLKKIIAMAVVPGSLIGALPPLIGWVSSGGDIFNPIGLSLALTFFIWQVPHFWLLLLLFDKEYKEAGYPTLTEKFNKLQLKRISFIWIIALFVNSLLIPFFYFPKNLISVSIIIVCSIWLLTSNISLLKDSFDKTQIKKNFLNLNLYILFVVFTLFIDKLFLQSI
ncbi:MAG TPA: protoheme IX farnesyltransferase [Melioribacteraceae bacterium]|nr:protoheme IX farnesyltransferase [Melioribacteraceae bacterium]